MIVALLIIAITCSSIALVMNLIARHDRDRREAGLRAELAPLREFCRITLHMQRYDATALEGDDPKARQHALDMIAHDTIHHGVSSVQLCAGAKMPPAHQWCAIVDDHHCLAKQAKRFYEVLQ